MTEHAVPTQPASDGEQSGQQPIEPQTPGSALWQGDIGRPVAHDTEDPEFQRLFSRAELETVRAVVVHAERVGKPNPEAEVVPNTTDLTIQVQHSQKPSSGRLAYRVAFEVEFPPSRDQPGAKVRTQYEVLVRVPEDVELSVDDLERFGAATIVTTAYPYFRENVQNHMARLGLRPVTLGLLTPPLSIVEEG